MQLNNDCGNGLSCLNGVCLNAACNDQTNCTCPQATATPTAQPTQIAANTPTAIPSATPAQLLSTGPGDTYMQIGIVGIVIAIIGGLLVFGI